MHSKCWLKNLRRPVWRPRHRWEDNVKMNLREIWSVSVEYNHLAQNRVQGLASVNPLMNLQVLHKVHHFLTI